MFSVRHWRLKTENAKANEAFNQAVKFLSGNSAFAADLIRDIRSHRKTVTIKVNFGSAAARDNGWVGPMFDMGRGGGTITWNASRKKVKGVRSAAMGLMHELGHAYQFLSEKRGMKRVLRPSFFGRCYRGARQERVVQSTEFIEKIEDTNVAAIELTVANEINASLSKQGAPEDALEPTRSSYL